MIDMGQAILSGLGMIICGLVGCWIGLTDKSENALDALVRPLTLVVFFFGGVTLMAMGYDRIAAVLTSSELPQITAQVKRGLDFQEAHLQEMEQLRYAAFRDNQDKMTLVIAR